MKLPDKFLIISLLLLFSFMISNSIHPEKKVVHNDSNWDILAPYFSPPPIYEDDYGSFRSPLIFYDNHPVKTQADWAERRIEILSQWHQMMGKWPPFIQNQDIEFITSVKRDNFTQHRIRFCWAPGEKTDGYLLIPDCLDQENPAVITVYYEPETAIGFGKPKRDFAYQLTKRGFITLSIGTTQATQKRTYSIYYPSLNEAKVQPLSMLAYAAANAWYVLASLPEVDSTRIGIMGHSFGGKWAMFASCLFENFACAAWSDPGIVFDESRPDINYWEPWYLGYHPPPWRKRGVITDENPARGLYPVLVAEGYDLHELHALMAPRPFLVSGGSEDTPIRWQALNHSIAVNKLLGYENRVGMTNRPDHTPNTESNEIIYHFFEYFLMKDGQNDTEK
jgi:hypothetical protein